MIVLNRMTEARANVVRAQVLADLYLPGSPNRPAIREDTERLDAGIESLQRVAVRPTPPHFVVRSAEEKKP